MARKTIEEQIKALEEKEKTIKARKQQLQDALPICCCLRAKEKEKERKARTHRLIEIGGAVESVLGRPIEKEELPKLITFLKKQEEKGQFLSKALSEQTKTTNKE